MLLADVLNSEATVNDFDVIKSLSFIPGYQFRLVIRLKQPHHIARLRYVAASGSSLVVTLPQKDGTSLSVAMTAFADDRSVWFADVSAAQAEELIGGNFTFDLTEGPKTTPGWVENGLALVITGEC